MAPPPVSIYVTSLTSQPKVRQNIELLRRSLRALEIPYTEHDLVMDEGAKTRWQRSKPAGQIIGLPGYLVGGEWVGTMDDFEYAAETGTLPQFLHQDTDLAGNTSIGEAELERLMREMSDADLDALAAEVAKGSGSAAASGSAAEASGLGKIGLLTPEAAVPAGSSSPEEKEVVSAAKAGSSNAGGGSEKKDTAGSTTIFNSIPVPKAADISSAAQQTLESVTSKASELLSSLAAGNVPHLTSDSAIADTPTSGRSPTTLHPDPAPASGDGESSGPSGKDKTRRMSKEEIAAEMMRADTVEGLMASLDMAEGKEKVD